MDQNKGRVTIPTDVDVIQETLELSRRWGADAVRDCDGPFTRQTGTASGYAS